jgi:hypothetical protein
MAVGQGFSKAVTSGSIFHYDTGDMINSFKGKPGTNSLAGVIRNYNGYSISNYTNGKLFETNGYTETVNIPALGTRTVESVEIYNVYSGYGEDGNYNCCPSLFNYSNGWLNTPLSGSTLYMYEIIYKCESGYTNANYMYHYEYQADNTYNTEYGVFDTSRQIALGDGWYYGWGSFTTQATTSKGYFGLWYYNYNVRDKVSIASISLQQGDSVLPPRQLIPNATTRSNTQALVDLIGNTTLDVTNASFNSTGLLTFDGTNDFIDTNRTDLVAGTGPFAIEAVYKNNSGYGAIITNYGPGYTSNSVWIFAGGLYLNGGYGYVSNWGSGRINGTHHIVCVREADGTFKTYFDGVLDVSNNPGSAANVPANINWRIGSDVNAIGAEPFNGDIYVVKVYNRALTAGEVKQNYGHYKTRFNLP